MTMITRREIAELLITDAKWSDQEWEHKTGISRQTFWRLRTKKVLGIESKTIELMAKACNAAVTWNDGSKQSGELINNKKEKEADMSVERAVISNQLVQIDDLNNKVKYLKEQLSIANETKKDRGWHFKMSSLVDTRSFKKLPHLSMLIGLHKAANFTGYKKDTVYTDNQKIVFKGNTDALGYSTEELSKLKQTELFLMYHADCVKEIVKTLKHILRTEDTFFASKGIRVLKAKDGSWQSYETEYYWNKVENNWNVTSYWSHLGNQIT